MERNQTIFTILIVLSALVFPASAYSISSVNINPPSNIVSGDQVSLAFSLVPSPFFPPDHYGYTANPNNTILITTSLDNPSWKRDTILNGQQSHTEASGNTLELDGWDIAYKIVAGAGLGERINITLIGNAPQVSSTSTSPFITVCEFDEDGNKIQGTEQVFRQTVINQKDLASSIYLAQKDLDQLHEDIIAKQAFGIDTSLEKALENSATESLSIAKNLPPAQYQIALDRLDNVSLSIKSGEIALDRAYAQQEIEKAAKPLSHLDSIIEWFDGNKSTSNYPGLDRIRNAQHNATIIMNSGSISMEAGDFDGARLNARLAFNLSNQTLNDARILQKRAMDPLTPIWDNEIPIVVVGGFVAIYLMFKPKKRKPKKVEKDGKQ